MNIAPSATGTPIRNAFFKRAAMDPQSMSLHVPPQEYIDGYCIPTGTMSLVALKGGGGKTTAIIRAGIEYAATGLFKMFGERQHERPGKVLFILGEESSLMFNQRLAHVLPKGTFQQFMTAANAGRIEVVSWSEAQEKIGTNDRLINKEGQLTAIGNDLIEATEEFQPNLIVFDTLTSLCSAEQNSDTLMYEAVGVFNRFTSRMGCTTILTSHITKEGVRKIDPDVTADDLIAMMRGSAAIINGVRHALVGVPCPAGLYENQAKKKGDDVWLFAMKSNLGHDKAAKTFPVVRSASLMTFVATDEDGRAIGDVVDEEERDLRRALRPFVFHTICLAAELGHPFASRGTNSLTDLVPTVAQGLLPDGATPRLVESVFRDLVADQLIVICVEGKSDRGVADIKYGPYSEPVPGTQKLKPYKKGAPDIKAMADIIKMRVKDDPDGNAFDKFTTTAMRQRNDEFEDATREAEIQSALTAEKAATDAERSAARQAVADKKAADAE